MTGWVKVAVLGLGAFAAGCAGDGDDKTDSGAVGGCTDGSPTVSVGTGDVSFVALAAGDPVTIVFGPQGGWHIDVGGSVTAMNQEVAVTPKVTLVSQATQIAGDQQPQYIGLASYDDAACTGQFWGIRAFVDDVVTPPLGMSYAEMICTFEGQELTLEVTVEDITTGKTATSSQSVIARLDAAAMAACP